MPGRGAMARNEHAVEGTYYTATEAQVNAVRTRTGAQMSQTVRSDLESIAGDACGDMHNFRAGARGASSASALHNDAPVCWNTRNLDFASLRLWFIRRVAQEAIKELQQEEQHVQHER